MATLKEWREHNGLTIREALHLLGMASTGNYSRVELGTTFAGHELMYTIRLITAALGPDVDLLDHWLVSNPKEAGRIRNDVRARIDRFLRQRELKRGEERTSAGTEARKGKSSKGTKGAKGRRPGTQRRKESSRPRQGAALGSGA